MIPEAMQRVKRTAKQLQDDLKQAAKKEVIKELFLSFFADSPEVKAVKWTQYTPSFNDGAVCTFSLYGPEFALTNEELKEPGEEWSSAWGQEGALKKRLSAFEKDFEELQDVFQMAFGDGFKVIVTSDGKVQVEEYDHD